MKPGRLDSSPRDPLLRGSENGKVVVPGNPNDSQFYKLVALVTEPGMQFKGKKLRPEAIDEFAEWIRAGVPYGETAEEADAAFARCHQALGVPQTRETIGAQGRAGRESRGPVPLPRATPKKASRHWPKPTNARSSAARISTSPGCRRRRSGCRVCG